MECDRRSRLQGAPYRDFSYPPLPGIDPAGGRWTPTPETFVVEELPRYEFCGEGEHAALLVEKAGLTTREVALGVAARLGLPPAAVGYAGMKDKASTARQAFTVTGVSSERARDAFEAQGCRVLRCTRHRNKLRLGHLAANRFRLWVEGVDPVSARRALERLAAEGVPNYFGPQRFGAGGDNVSQGLAILRGGRRASRWKRDLLVSAVQAYVFNEVVARRIEADALSRALAGDVLRREDSGGLFVCEDPAADGPRVAAFEVSPTGPLPGRKMVSPRGAVAEAEAAVLRDLGIDLEWFRRETGARRPLRFALRALSVEPGAGGAWLGFTCPAGAFATAVVQEVTGRPGGRG